MSRLLAKRFVIPSSRLFTTSTTRPAFSTGPAPPRLPPKDQEEFERLQKLSTGAFSTPKDTSTRSTIINQTLDQPSSPPAAPRTTPQVNQPSTLSTTKADLAAVNARIQATGDGKELHPDIRRGAKPEFEGERNPATGETGGPKNEPLRWGSTANSGDWSYNGRVTDF